MFGKKVLESVFPLVERVDFSIKSLVDLGGSQVKQLISSEVVPNFRILSTLSRSGLVILLLGRL